ncbi:MAG TPA: glycosyltransferase family 2 protein [Patescibacteria group bacterium]
MKKNRKKLLLSIIIPAYNEEKTIAQIIKKVKKAKVHKDIRKEIIVIDDASYDKTHSLLQKTKGIKVLKHKENMGKGAAVRTGLEEAKGDLIIVQDADLEYDPNDYARLMEPIMKKKTKVVYGSRLRNYPIRIVGTSRTPLLAHYLGNKFLTLFTNFLYGGEITDMETCYKVFHKEVVDGLVLNAQRFDFEPEITAKILKRGYKIYEVPINVKPRGYNEGKKIGWKDGFGAVYTLVKYRFLD